MYQSTAIHGKEFNCLEFDLRDLGATSANIFHLYYIFSANSSIPLGNCLLEREGIEILIKNSENMGLKYWIPKSI